MSSTSLLIKSLIPTLPLTSLPVTISVQYLSRAIFFHGVVPYLLAVVLRNAKEGKFFCFSISGFMHLSKFYHYTYGLILLKVINWLLGGIYIATI